MKGFQLEEACIDSVLLTISAAMFSTPSIFIYYYVSGLSVSTGLVLCCYWFALSCCFSCCYRWFKSRKNRSMVVEREEQLGNIAMHADQYVVRDSTTSIIEPTGYQQSSSLPCGPAAIVGKSDSMR